MRPRKKLDFNKFIIISPFGSEFTLKDSRRNFINVKI